jgi:hypothetical protein
MKNIILRELRRIAHSISIIHSFFGFGAVFLPGNKLPEPEVKTVEYYGSDEDLSWLRDRFFYVKNCTPVFLSVFAMKFKSIPGIVSISKSQ